MPRGTLFKPPKRHQLDKNPLWQEVFMQESSDEEDGSDSDSDDTEMLQMYRDTMALKGIQTEKKKKKTEEVNRPMTEKPKIANNNDLTLPPIDQKKKAKKGKMTSKK